MFFTGIPVLTGTSSTLLPARVASSGWRLMPRFCAAHDSSFSADQSGVFAPGGAVG